MDGDNRPLSEIFAEAAADWCDKEAAATLLEDTKSLIMAQKQAMLGDMPVNRSEQIVKSTPDWYEHIEKIVAARKTANEAKIRLEIIRMQANEQNNQQANARAELRLS